jgi:predicted RND superfamily exporter protein
VAAFACVSLFAALSIPRIRIDLRIYDLVDPAFRSIGELQKMRADFGDQNELSLLISRRDGKPLDPERLCAIRDWLGRAWADNTEISDIFSPFDLRAPAPVTGKLWYPQMLSSDCSNYEQMKSTPWVGLLTDRLGGDFSARVSFRDSVERSAFGKFDPAPVGQLLRHAEKDLLSRYPELSVQISGDASFQWHFQQMFRDDFYINPLVIAVLVLFFRVFYGTWASGLLFMVSMLITGTIVYGTMALVGAPIDLLTNNLFLMTCISGLEDFLFVAHLARTENRISQAFRKILVPGFFTSLTTMVGFGSLLTSDLAIIRGFGVWAAWAVFVEWVVTFYFLPSFCTVFGPNRSWVRPSQSVLSRACEKLAALNAPRGLLRLGLALAVAGTLSFPWLRYDESPRAIFPSDHPHAQAFRYLRETRGWEGMVYLLFPDAPAEGSVVPEVDAVLREVQRASHVVRIDRPDEVVRHLTSQVDPSLRPLVAREFSLSDAFRKYVRPEAGLRVGVYLDDLDLSSLGETLAQFRSVCGERCIPVGESVVLHDYSERVSRTLMDSFVVSIVLVILVVAGLAWILKTDHVFRLVYSSIWSPLLMIGVMVVFRVPVNLVTSIFVAILVGLTGDNAIQFIFAAQEEASPGGSTGGGLNQGIQERSVAVVQLLGLLSVASLLFLGLSLVPMKVLGLLFSAGFAMTLVGDLWLLKGLLVRE